MGGCTRRVQTAWPCLGSALNSPWLEPGRPNLRFVSINGPRKQWSHLAEPRLPVFKADFSARASYHRPSILIAYTLMSGCGQISLHILNTLTIGSLFKWSSSANCITLFSLVTVSWPYMYVAIHCHC